MNYLIPFSLLSASAVVIYIIRRKEKVALSLLKLFTKAELFIKNTSIINSTKNSTTNSINSTTNLTTTNTKEEKKLFKPQYIKVSGDLIKMEYNFQNPEEEMKKLFNNLPYYTGTIKLELTYQYFNNSYYFIYTDTPEECLNKLQQLLSSLNSNKKPKSKLLSATLQKDQENEYDALTLLQKYEGPFSQFSFNSIRVSDIISDFNKEIKLTIINDSADCLHFINNDLIIF
tara:strand:- start:567 stop:1256 length:690 start_codon:yes stop_codon:yes gene_type:complete